MSCENKHAEAKPQERKPVDLYSAHRAFQNYLGINPDEIRDDHQDPFGEKARRRPHQPIDTRGFRTVGVQTFYPEIEKIEYQRLDEMTDEQIVKHKAAGLLRDVLLEEGKLYYVDETGQKKEEIERKPKKPPMTE